eukprot:tig00020878_g14864.t1
MVSAVKAYQVNSADIFAAAPTSSVLLLVLDGNYATWTNASDARFLAGLAELEGVPVSRFKVLSRREGSVVLTIEVTAAAGSNVTAEALAVSIQQKALAGALVVNGVRVTGVQIVANAGALRGAVTAPVSAPVSVDSPVPGGTANPASSPIPAAAESSSNTLTIAAAVGAAGAVLAIVAVAVVVVIVVRRRRNPNRVDVQPAAAPAAPPV